MRECMGVPLKGGSVVPSYINVVGKLTQDAAADADVAGAFLAVLVLYGDLEDFLAFAGGEREAAAEQDAALGGEEGVAIFCGPLFETGLAVGELPAPHGDGEEDDGDEDEGDHGG